MAASAPKIPAPNSTPETAPFWEAAAKGKLLVKHCTACGRAHHYPRPHCPFCGSDRTEWKESAGRLAIKRCAACGQVHHYPRARCPFCGSDRTEWRDATGRGTIYSYSVMRRVPVPYALAYVTLEEGVTIDRKSTRLNSSHRMPSRMPSSA